MNAPDAPYRDAMVEVGRNPDLTPHACREGIWPVECDHLCPVDPRKDPR